jgi:hypothetical protein
MAVAQVQVLTAVAHMVTWVHVVPLPQQLLLVLLLLYHHTMRALLQCEN